MTFPKARHEKQYCTLYAIGIAFVHEPLVGIPTYDNVSPTADIPDSES